MSKNQRLNQISHTVVGVTIMLIIGAIHAFRFGSYLNGDVYILYYSYASDIIVPFGFYFVLSMNEIQIRFLQQWYAKAFIVFGLATFTEIMQIFGFYVLGVTFDIFDILMFGIGVALAVLLDKKVFERFVPYWKMVGVD
jgi:hypothetical protein